MHTLSPAALPPVAAATPTRPPARDADPPVRLREATERDRPALLALHRAALVGNSRGHYSDAQIRSLLRHLPTLDPALIADRTYLVAEVDGRIVACGGWSARPPGYLPALGQGATAPDAPRAPLIRAMYTLPSHTRRGIGRQILAAAERAAMARHDQAVELDALLGGVPLYLSAGYEPLERTVLHMPDGQQIAVVHMRQRRPLLRPGLRAV